jgi:NADH-quinone oxidoreductase subunit L
MPLTWITSLLGSLALIGTPFFAGFYSKDSIISVVAASTLPGSTFAYLAVSAGVFVTAFYSFRMYFLVFHGEERFRNKPFPPEDDHAAAHHDGDDHETHAEPGAHHDDHAAPRESPWVVTLPLVLLAIPSVGIGFLTEGPMIFGGFFLDSILVLPDLHPAMTQLAHDWHGPLAFALHAFTGPVFWLALGGVTLAWFLYLKRPDLSAAIRARAGFVYRLLENKYYMDWFNEHVLSRAAVLLGTALWKKGDVGTIDGVFIDGSANAIGRLGRSTRALQSGYLYWYALVMIVGVIGLMTWQLWPYLGNLFGR